MSSLQKFHRRTNAGISNVLHTGTVSISGTVQVGSVLTANNTLADANGLGTFAYQWKRSGTAISGATASTYTIVSADISNTLSVTITYTDGKGFVESETSAATILVPISLGSGNDTKGYYLGLAGDNTSYMYVAPKSTEAQLEWGSYGTSRGTVSTTNGVANTTTLFNLGAAAHPSAHYCRSLTTGGYNNWYLPAINELKTAWANKGTTPFATSNAFLGDYYWSSTEYGSREAIVQSFGAANTQYNKNKSFSGVAKTRAVRRSLV